MSPVKSPEPSSAPDTRKKAKIVDEKDVADELPPGWTKEVKTRKIGSKTKIDRFYTDPVTGYIFRSLKTAQEYVKTGELGRLAIKPKNNGDERLHMEERTERSESKLQISETLSRKRMLDETIKSELFHSASKRLAAPSPPPPLPPPVPKTRQATRLAGVAVDAPPPTPPSQRKTRRVTRQAGIKIDSPPPSPPDTRCSRQATRATQVKLATPKENHNKTEKHDENADIDNNPNHNQENHENPKEHSKIKIETGPPTSPPPEDQPPPTAAVVPPVDFVKQELPVVNPTIPQDPSINFSTNDLWTDPCIEFAVKTLTGAIPCEDLNKPETPSPSPLKVPIEELWTDPCIEFAVKTLTGAIPVQEDRNSRGPHEFYLPDTGMSSCQTDVLSRQFETGQDKQQQDLTSGKQFTKIR